MYSIIYIYYIYKNLIFVLVCFFFILAAWSTFILLLLLYTLYSFFFSSLFCAIVHWNPFICTFIFFFSFRHHPSYYLRKFYYIFLFHLKLGMFVQLFPVFF